MQNLSESHFAHNIHFIYDLVTHLYFEHAISRLLPHNLLGQKTTSMNLNTRRYVSGPRSRKKYENENYYVVRSVDKSSISMGSMYLAGRAYFLWVLDVRPSYISSWMVERVHWCSVRGESLGSYESRSWKRWWFHSPAAVLSTGRNLSKPTLYSKIKQI